MKLIWQTVDRSGHGIDSVILLLIKVSYPMHLEVDVLTFRGKKIKGIVRCPLRS